MTRETLQGTIKTRANVYFDGRCVSHSVTLADGVGKSVGVILAGSELTFNTGAPEIMECVSGACRWRLKGDSAWQDSAEGQSFSVPGNTAFEISVGDQPYHYVCHFG